MAYFEVHLTESQTFGNGSRVEVSVRLKAPHNHVMQEFLMNAARRELNTSMREAMQDPYEERWKED